MTVDLKLLLGIQDTKSLLPIAPAARSAALIKVSVSLSSDRFFLKAHTTARLSILKCTASPTSLDGCITRGTNSPSASRVGVVSVIRDLPLLWSENSVVNGMLKAAACIPSNVVKKIPSDGKV